MAVTQYVAWGTPFTMVQNQIYAVPPHNVYRFSTNDGNTYQYSNDPLMTTPPPLTLTNGTDVARAFVRCTTGNGLCSFTKSG